jgi:hypothetical protein
MTADRPTPPTRGSAGSPTLTFRGGGWVIVLAAALVVLLLGWSLLGPLLGRRPVGDGRTLESYGFDLANLAIDRADLVPSGMPRGFLASLDDPAHLRGSEITIYNERNRPKYLVPTDRVLGIVVNGQPHAWPLSILNVHEIINDTVGGVPVAATYSPWCDAVSVFERTVAGEVRAFEVSGLLCDANLVFCDKPATAEAAAGTPERADSSLFVQLDGIAIAGPLVGTRLVRLPGACITTWADWLAAHPTTTVTERDPATIRRIKEISYARYFLSPKLDFPADPVPSDDDLAAAGQRLKSPMIAVRLDEGWELLDLEAMLSDAGPDRVVERTVGGRTVRVHLPRGPAVARVESTDGAPVETVPLLRFAAEARGFNSSR